MSPKLPTKLGLFRAKGPCCRSWVNWFVSQSPGTAGSQHSGGTGGLGGVPPQAEMNRANAPRPGHARGGPLGCSGEADRTPRAGRRGVRVRGGGLHGVLLGCGLFPRLCGIAGLWRKCKTAARQAHVLEKPLVATVCCKTRVTPAKSYGSETSPRTEATSASGAAGFCGRAGTLLNS